MKDNRFYLARGPKERKEEIYVYYGTNKPHISVSGCSVGDENCTYIGLIESYAVKEITKGDEIVEISIKRKKAISSSNKKESKFKFKNLFKWLKK